MQFDLIYEFFAFPIFVASIFVTIECCRSIAIIVFVTNPIGRTTISALLFSTAATNIPKYIVSSNKSICTARIYATRFTTLCWQPILGIGCITTTTTSTSKISINKISNHFNWLCHNIESNLFVYFFSIAITISIVSSISICISAGLASIGFTVSVFSTEIATILMELRRNAFT